MPVTYAFQVPIHDGMTSTRFGPLRGFGTLSDSNVNYAILLLFQRVSIWILHLGLVSASLQKILQFQSPPLSGRN